MIASAPAMEIDEIKEITIPIPQILNSPDFINLYPVLSKIDKKDLETNSRLAYILNIFDEIEKDKKHHQKFVKKNHNIEKVLTFSDYVLTITDSGMLIASGVGIPVLLPIACTLSLLCNFANISIRSMSKYFANKKNKHKEIYTISNTVINSISKQCVEALRDNKISAEEFDNIVNIKENYDKLKKEAEINNKYNFNTVEFNKQVENMLIQKGKNQFKDEIITRLKN